ncbi:MAG: TRAM domain-containing protein, partial [Clostridia bacterium]|nr:TRAM domain-containing protein [Clostridia bacterium]
AFPGERLLLTISKEGKENGQGIGYLEDGAMVIVDNGREYIGSEQEVVVTSITQTSAGRLIFSKIE